MVVVDASAIVALIDGGPDGAAVADRLDGHALVAPHLLDQEVMQAKCNAFTVRSPLRALPLPVDGEKTSSHGPEEANKWMGTGGTSDEAKREQRRPDLAGRPDWLRNSSC